MALTVTQSGDWFVTGGMGGKYHTADVTIAFDDSYPTGGETLNASDVGMRTIHGITVKPSGGLEFAVEDSLPATSVSILAYVPGATVGADGAEVVVDAPLSGVASTTSQSIGVVDASETLRFGLMKEVADTEDLSSITGVQVHVWGI